MKNCMYNKLHSESWQVDFTCDQCGLMFYTKNNLAQHIKRKHTALESNKQSTSSAAMDSEEEEGQLEDGEIELESIIAQLLTDDLNPSELLGVLLF